MGEIRYGDEKTIHGSQYVDVEVDYKGHVVAVWFRCMPLPFKASKAKKSRAKEMRDMYKGETLKLRAVIMGEENGSFQMQEALNALAPFLNQDA